MSAVLLVVVYTTLSRALRVQGIYSASISNIGSAVWYSVCSVRGTFHLMASQATNVYISRTLCTQCTVHVWGCSVNIILARGGGGGGGGHWPGSNRPRHHLGSTWVLPRWREDTTRVARGYYLGRERIVPG